MFVFIQKKLKKNIVKITRLLMSLFLVVVVSSIMFLPSVNGAPTTNDIGSFITNVVSIQTGEKSNGAWMNSDWGLHIGIGGRSYTTAVQFDSPFQEPPKVAVALSGQDVDGEKNNRIRLIATDITVDGFNLVYQTWHDTVVYSVWVTWTAIGLQP
jgi:hypothetical protein